VDIASFDSRGATMSSTQSPPAGEQVKDKAQEVAGQAQEKAQEAAGQARDRVREQVDSRSTQAGEQVSGHAKDLRSVGDALREQGNEQPAKLADQAAGHVERVGSWLTDSDADRILGDVEDFARKNPWAVVAGGVALGFAASRMLKASSADRYETRGTRPSPPSPPSPPRADTPERALPRPAEPGDTVPVGEPRFGTPGAV
jgi:hypothetical protein